MSRAARVLLPHVNMLLCALAGGALATAARLRWDPSLYVPLRALCPAETRAALAALAIGAGAVLLAAALAAAALQLPPRRHAARAALLITSAALQTCVWAGGWAGGAWLWAQARRWLASEAAARAREALAELEQHLGPLVALAARYVPLPAAAARLLRDAADDAPWNLYVAGGALLAAALLLPLAAVLSLLSARPYPRAAPAAPAAEKAPLTAPPWPPQSPRRARAAYRGGRLVLLP